jgi:hypothetical protein
MKPFLATVAHQSSRMKMKFFALASQESIKGLYTSVARYFLD